MLSIFCIHICAIIFHVRLYTKWCLLFLAGELLRISYGFQTVGVRRCANNPAVSCYLNRGSSRFVRQVAYFMQKSNNVSNVVVSNSNILSYQHLDNCIFIHTLKQQQRRRCIIFRQFCSSKR